MFYDINKKKEVTDSYIVSINGIRTKVSNISEEKLNSIGIYKLVEINDIPEFVELYNVSIDYVLRDSNNVIEKQYIYTLKPIIELYDVFKSALDGFLDYKSSLRLTVNSYEINADLFSLVMIDSIITVTPEFIETRDSEGNIISKEPVYIDFRLYDNSFVKVTISELKEFKVSINKFRLDVMKVKFNLESILNSLDEDKLLELFKGIKYLDPSVIYTMLNI